jgi:hypothetical protein
MKVTTDSSIFGEVNLYAGGVTWVDREYDEFARRMDALATLWRWLRELQSGKDHRVVFAKVGSWSDKWQTLSGEQIDLLQHRSFDYDKSQSDGGERAVWLALECGHQGGARAATEVVAEHVKKYLDDCKELPSRPTLIGAWITIRKVVPNATRNQVF